VFVFPTSADTTGYRTEIWAPASARPEALDLAVGSQLHALDQDVRVWNALAADFRPALLADERRLDDLLAGWLRDGVSSTAG
jgi:hypothetical protein